MKEELLSKFEEFLKTYQHLNEDEMYKKVQNSYQTFKENQDVGEVIVSLLSQSLKAAFVIYQFKGVDIK